MNTRDLPPGQWFIEIMKVLDYPIETHGHCCGIACVALQSMQTDQGKKFNTRLNTIYYDIYLKAFKSNNVWTLVNSLNTLELALKDDRDITSLPSFQKEAKQLFLALPTETRIDLLAWFDSIFGYQNTTDIFLSEPPQVQNRLPMFDNVELTQAGTPVTSIGYLSGMHHAQELKKTLEIFAEESNKQNISAPVSFLFRNINHLVTFTYYPKENTWQYYDANFPGIKICSLDDIVQSINIKLAKNKIMANTMQIFTCTEQEHVQQVIDQVKKREEYISIHNITDQKKLAFDSIGGSWFYTAIAAGDYDTVFKLIDKVDIREFKQQAFKGLSPLSMALYFNHQLGLENTRIIHLLINHYPDLIDVPAQDGITTPLVNAIVRNDIELVKKLIRLGAKITDIALNTAFERGRIEMARFLAETSIKDPGPTAPIMNNNRKRELEDKNNSEHLTFKKRKLSEPQENNNPLQNNPYDRLGLFGSSIDHSKDKSNQEMNINNMDDDTSSNIKKIHPIQQDNVFELIYTSYTSNLNPDENIKKQPEEEKPKEEKQDNIFDVAYDYFSHKKN